VPQQQKWNSLKNKKNDKNERSEIKEGYKKF